MKVPDKCKECDSLLSRDLGGFNCRMAHEYDDKQCPCLDCLVKTMCQSECDDFIAYREGLPLGCRVVKKEL